MNITIILGKILILVSGILIYLQKLFVGARILKVVGSTKRLLILVLLAIILLVVRFKIKIFLHLIKKNVENYVVGLKFYICLLIYKFSRDGIFVLQIEKARDYPELFLKKNSF